ncbi:uncharacterized protein LOC105845557 [Hydra vulgaris]|uniref:uncharacterized protein LOC105845557 n=1 Tax=Hydra vulgaris TaxID=6087 RepID=UPI0032EA1B59
MCSTDVGWFSTDGESVSPIKKTNDSQNTLSYPSPPSRIKEKQIWSVKKNEISPSVIEKNWQNQKEPFFPAMKLKNKKYANCRKAIYGQMMKRFILRRPLEVHKSKTILRKNN